MGDTGALLLRDAAALLDQLGPWAAQAALAWARCLGVFAFLPLFQALAFPMQVRIAIPLATLPVALLGLRAAGTLPAPEGLVALLLGLGAEFFIGALLGLPVMLAFHAAQSAGELVDIKTGANNNAVFGTGAGSPEGPAQTLMVQLALLAFLAADGLQTMVRACWRSYTLVPPGGVAMLSADALPALAALAAGQVAALALQIFAPLMIVFLLGEAAIGLAGRLAPQLQVSTIAAPAKSLTFPLLLLALAGAPWFLLQPMAGALAGMQGFVELLLRR